MEISHLNNNQRYNLILSLAFNLQTRTNYFDNHRLIDSLIDLHSYNFIPFDEELFEWATSQEYLSQLEGLNLLTDLANSLKATVIQDAFSSYQDYPNPEKKDSSELLLGEALPTTVTLLEEASTCCTQNALDYIQKEVNIMNKPLNNWISASSPQEQEAIYQLENICGSFLQNLSEDAKYTLILEIANRLPNTSSLNPQIQQSIKSLSIDNLLNLLAALRDSF